MSRKSPFRLNVSIKVEIVPDNVLSILERYVKIENFNFIEVSPQDLQARLASWALKYDKALYYIEKNEQDIKEWLQLQVNRASRENNLSWDEMQEMIAIAERKNRGDKDEQ